MSSVLAITNAVFGQSYGEHFDMGGGSIHEPSELAEASKQLREKLLFEEVPLYVQLSLIQGICARALCQGDLSGHAPFWFEC